MSWSRVWPWLAVLVAAAGLYLFGRAQGAASAASAAAVQDARTVLAIGKAYRATDRALAVQATAARATASHLGTKVATLTGQLDSLRALPQTPVLLGQEAAVCYNALTLCTARGDTLARADSLDRLRAEANALGWARADSSLAGLLRVKTCKILFVACPSRTASFFVGAGLVELTHLLVGKP